MSNVTKVQAKLHELGFNRFAPSAPLMKNLRKVPEPQKCGIYVHTFKGGKEFYLGISVDIEKRYRQHLKTHPDIEQTCYLLAGPEEQFLLEFKFLAELLRMGVKVRNVLVPYSDYTKKEIADIIGQLTQLDWITNDSSRYEGRHILRDEHLERNMQRKVDLMLKHPLYTPEMLSIFGEYIRTCVPMPAVAERTFWTAGCMNKGLYPKPFQNLQVMMRVNVRAPEVFSAVIDTHRPERPIIGYNLYVAASPISAKELSRLKSLDEVTHIPNHQKSVDLPLHQFIVRSHDVMREFLRSADLRRAAKLHNMMLMRKGQVQRNLAACHNLPLSKLWFKNS
jgi:hypothetical protein